jgi:hypothetical protein
VYTGKAPADAPHEGPEQALKCKNLATKMGR